MSKLSAGKAGLILTALLLTMGGAGAAFAAWTDSISIQGTVQTATIEWEVVGEPEPCIQKETAWALCEVAGSDCFTCHTGWGTYFKYQIGTAEEPKKVPLVAGRHIEIGQVTVQTITSGNGPNLVVDYVIENTEWTMILTHLHAGKGRPSWPCAPGRFPYKSDDDDDAHPALKESSRHTYVIPLSELEAEEGDTVYIAAHAEVERPFAPPGVVVSPEGRRLVITAPCTGSGYNFLVTFEIENTGTVPLRIADILFAYDQDGVAAELETVWVIGEQLHESEILSGQVRISVEACDSDSRTVEVTVEAMQWNIYS